MSEPSTRAADTPGGSGAMFDAIADRYDAMNRVLSFGTDRGWRRLAVRALELGPSARVLDLATGTADMVLEVLSAHPDARVVGVDPSREMLRVAEAKLSARRLNDRAQLVVGSAEQIPLPDSTVDAITMAFGIRNVPDRPRALADMARVLRPGGRVAILELSDPQKGWIAPFARFHIRHVVPSLGALLSGAREYRYLERSIAAFPQPEAFAETMRGAGLEVVMVRPLTFGVACLFVATRADSGEAAR